MSLVLRWLLMSLSGMVEIPRLQAKRSSVMPAQSLPRTRSGAGIQGGGGRKYAKPGFPLSRERRKEESRLRVDVNKIPRLRAEGRLIPIFAISKTFVRACAWPTASSSSTPVASQSLVLMTNSCAWRGTYARLFAMQAEGYR